MGAWCRVPLFLSFLPELMILLSFFKFSVFRFLVYFLNFVLFFFVLCKLCWRSFLNSYRRFNFYGFSYIFYCFSFLVDLCHIKKVFIKVILFHILFKIIR